MTDRTHRVWQPRLGRDLSREDARQIAENVAGFFAILAEWSRTEMPIPAMDSLRFANLLHLELKNVNPANILA